MLQQPDRADVGGEGGATGAPAGAGAGAPGAGEVPPQVVDRDDRRSDPDRPDDLGGDRPSDGDPDDGAGDGGGPGHRPWYRRPLPVVLLAVVALFLVGAGLFAWQWSTRGAEEASTSDLIEQYRREAGSDRPAGFLQPATGVYTYDAVGTEKLSILGTTQQWGPTMPGTVTAQDGDCFTLRIDYSNLHWAEDRYCHDGNRLLQTGSLSYLAFDFGATVIGETTTFVCDPPVEVIRVTASPGDSWPSSCVGTGENGVTNSTSTGTQTFVGIEQVSVDGRPEAALHYRQDRELSGSQTGTEESHNWFAVTDGMLLRSTHDTRVASPSPIGDVNYTEQGEFTLTSRTPTR